MPADPVADFLRAYIDPEAAIVALVLMATLVIVAGIAAAIRSRAR